MNKVIGCIHINYYCPKSKIPSEICVYILQQSKCIRVVHAFIQPTQPESLLIEESRSSKSFRAHEKIAYIPPPSSELYSQLTPIMTLTQFISQLKDVKELVTTNPFDQWFSDESQIPMEKIQQINAKRDCEMCEFHKTRLEQLKISQNDSEINIQCSKQQAGAIAQQYLYPEASKFNILFKSSKAGSIKTAIMTICERNQNGYYIIKPYNDEYIGGLFTSNYQYLDDIIPADVFCEASENCFAGNSTWQLPINCIQFCRTTVFTPKVEAKTDKFKQKKNKLPEQFENIIIFDFEAFLTEPAVPSEIGALRIVNGELIAIMHCFFKPEPQYWAELIGQDKFRKTIEVVQNITNIPLPDEPEFKQLNAFEGSMIEFNQLFMDFCTLSSTSLQEKQFVTVYKQCQAFSMNDSIMVAKDTYLEQKILTTQLKNTYVQKVCEIEDLHFRLNKTKMDFVDIHSERKYNYCPFHKQFLEQQELLHVHCSLDDSLYLYQKVFPTQQLPKIKTCSNEPQLTSSQLNTEYIQPDIVIQQQRKQDLLDSVKIVKKFLKQEIVSVEVMRNNIWYAGIKVSGIFDKKELKSRYKYVVDVNCEKMGLVFDFQSVQQQKKVNQILLSCKTLSETPKTFNFVFLETSILSFDPVVLYELHAVRFVNKQRVATLTLRVKIPEQIKLLMKADRKLSTKINLMKRFLKAKQTSALTDYTPETLKSIFDRFCQNASDSLPTQAVSTSVFCKTPQKQVLIVLRAEPKKQIQALKYFNSDFQNSTVEFSRFYSKNFGGIFEPVVENRCEIHKNGYCSVNFLEGVCGIGPKK
ncbi:Conserved_hypothetical protein [Hexamita inflata]|uniref:Uncharacterized protein n=2 Tax=Hexamita inflata TaxID=28002 RepID=A0ABP1JS29_9EUKA